MAEPQRRPSGLRNFLLGRVLDPLVWGNNYDRTTGQWSATPGQYIGGGASIVGNMLYPGSGRVATMVYNGTQGRGPLSFFNRNSPMGLQPATLDPVQPTPFVYGGTQMQPGMTQPAITPSFDPANPFAVPATPAPHPSGTAGVTPNWGRFTPNMPQAAGGGFQSFLGPSMGGARGRFSDGGRTGDAARAMFEGMRRAAAFAPIDTGPPRQA